MLVVFLEKDLECRMIVGAIMAQIESDKGGKAAMGQPSWSMSVVS